MDETKRPKKPFPNGPEWEIDRLEYRKMTEYVFEEACICVHDDGQIWLRLCRACTDIKCETFSKARGLIRASLLRERDRLIRICSR